MMMMIFLDSTVEAHAQLQSKTKSYERGENYTIQYQWSKSTTMKLCANTICTSNVHVSPSLGTIECIFCVENNHPACCFCSTFCFQKHWKQHDMNTTLINIDNNATKTMNKQKQRIKWIPVGNDDKIQIVTKTDVGHEFKVTCHALDLKGQCIGDPVTRITAVVLPGTTRIYIV